jgi:hypothetical protein
MVKESSVFEALATLHEYAEVEDNPNRLAVIMMGIDAILQRLASRVDTGQLSREALITG